jgi:hypothetical protein
MNRTTPLRASAVAAATYVPRGPSSVTIWRSVGRTLVPAALLVMASAALGVLHSDYFGVRQVIVSSPDPSVAEEVRAQLSLLPHPNTVFYPLSRLEVQAMSCPRVLRVDISRDLPSRIVVVVTERKPRFALRGDRDYVMVDADGVLLFHTTRPSVTYPRVEGAQVGAGPTGGRLSPDSVRCVLECEEGARKGGLGLSFTLNLGTRYDLHLVTTSGTDIRLGGPDNLVRKVIAAAAIERHALGRKMPPQYVDVRVPGQETWKPRKPAGAVSSADVADAGARRPAVVQRDDSEEPARPARKARSQADEDTSARRKKASDDHDPGPKAGATSEARRKSRSSDDATRSADTDAPRKRSASPKSTEGTRKDVR